MSDFSQSVRRAAAKGLGSILWSKLSQEDMLEAQQKVLKALLLATEDGEWVVRYAAIVGLESLANTLAESQPYLLPKITARYSELIDSETEPAICARTKYAMSNFTND